MNDLVGIIVDSGHGGLDSGAVGNGLLEKDLTLQAGKYMYNRLQELGIPSVLTREDDSYLPKADRIKKVLSLYNNSPNTILVSNHINAGGAEGAEIVYSLKNDSTLADLALQYIGDAGQIKRKAYQRRLPENPNKDYYYILRESGNTEPILVEYGFIDNAKDANKLRNNLTDYVEGVVKALAEYTGYPYTPPKSDMTNNYIVKKGDTLYSISRKFNIPVDTIKRLNNLTSNTLKIGQVLKLEEDQDLPNTTGKYIVKRGDTLYSISRRFSIPVDTIKQLNNLTDNALTVGQKLILEEDANYPQAEIYIVKNGDTLYSIAMNNNTTVDALKEFNNLTNNSLTVGQILAIPDTETSPDNSVTDYETYVVKKGDSLWQISRMFDISVPELINLNNLTDLTLQVGQQLLVPITNQSIDDNIYVVKAGDTLWSVARENNITVPELKELNNLTNNLLSIGQQLKIQ